MGDQLDQGKGTGIDQIVSALNQTMKPGMKTTVLLETPNDEEGYIEEIHTVLQWTEKQNQQM